MDAFARGAVWAQMGTIGIEATSLPMLEAVSRQWRAAVEAGYGRDDISAARLTLRGPARTGS